MVEGKTDYSPVVEETGEARSGGSAANGARSSQADTSSDLRGDRGGTLAVLYVVLR
jgi:hypothetical protein